MPEPKILSSVEGNVLTITLNNLEKRNAFDAEMSETVTGLINNADAQGVRVIVITANLSNGIFSAGHDLNDLKSASDFSSDPMFEMFDAIQSTPLPVVAKVSGKVFAGALHMLMVCDMVYATRDAQLVITANRMGVPFDIKDYQNWMAVMGVHKLKALFFRCTPATAEDAYNAGIFNTVLETPEALDQKIQEVCESIIGSVKEGIANTKYQVNTLCREVTLKSATVDAIEKSREEIFASDWFREDVQKLIDKIHHKNP
ncbi:enoyl-CoA hydratase-related protein [Cerasicoccus maritimus]|uniref:enoyl-CoA hydratase-related protein n=1 Tax=Cerasicoccus maritimus TaxID=490089 RepID=UPI002852729B|nr:enoyl-CoA hydratase-related protein [Cerasicoccus maritimus]